MFPWGPLFNISIFILRGTKINLTKAHLFQTSNKIVNLQIFSCQKKKYTPLT